MQGLVAWRCMSCHCLGTQPTRPCQVLIAACYQGRAFQQHATPRRSASFVRLSGRSRSGGAPRRHARQAGLLHSQLQRRGGCAWPPLSPAVPRCPPFNLLPSIFFFCPLAPPGPRIPRQRAAAAQRRQQGLVLAQVRRRRRCPAAFLAAAPCFCLSLPSPTCQQPTLQVQPVPPGADAGAGGAGAPAHAAAAQPRVQDCRTGGAAGGRSGCWPAGC